MIVICNGVPKSGTHFLGSIIKSLCSKEDSHYFVQNFLGLTELINIKTFNKDTGKFPELIKRIPTNSFIHGHLFFDKDIESYLKKNSSIKHVLIKRDPRDTMISMKNWRSYSTKFLSNPINIQRRSSFLSEFPDDASRLKQIILEMRDFNFIGFYNGCILRSVYV
jgi:hypothetical protein